MTITSYSDGDFNVTQLHIQDMGRSDDGSYICLAHSVLDSRDTKVVEAAVQVQGILARFINLNSCVENLSKLVISLCKGALYNFLLFIVSWIAEIQRRFMLQCK